MSQILMPTDPADAAGPTGRPMLCVSIHDVAPATWTDCLRLVQAVRAVADISLTWLVVPHYHFRPEQSLAMEACLNVALERGDELALHGYSHLDTEANSGGLSARFLRNVYTRREGEFAALTESEARRRLELGLDWFAQRGWTPSGFVPPAWLLGEGAWQALRDAPFAYTTTFSHFHCLPGGPRNAGADAGYSQQAAAAREVRQPAHGSGSGRADVRRGHAYRVEASASVQSGGRGAGGRNAGNGGNGGNGGNSGNSGNSGAGGLSGMNGGNAQIGQGSLSGQSSVSGQGSLSGHGSMSSQGSLAGQGSLSGQGNLSGQGSLNRQFDATGWHGAPGTGDESRGLRDDRASPQPERVPDCDQPFVQNNRRGTHAILSPSLVYAARNRSGRMLSRHVADATAAMLARSPLVRFSLHPPDARYPDLVRHIQHVLERLLEQREAVTKAEFARRVGCGLTSMDRASRPASSPDPSRNNPARSAADRTSHSD